MPSLRTLDVVHRLNAPTRAAATRRRRLRKSVAVACLLLGAAIVAPSGGPSTTDASASNASSKASASAPAALRGRHVVRFVPATPPPAGATRVDVWNSSGMRLIACAPTVGTDGGDSTDASPDTRSVAVALTEAEMARVAKHLGAQRSSPDGLIVSACL